MSEITIDDNFIRKWHPKYDKVENDEKEYREIIEQIRKEDFDRGIISEAITRRILRWKKARRATKFIVNNFVAFSEVVKKCIKLSEEEKLKILDDFPGIGVPVGSTILHLIYPDRFPIMDIRTAEVLYCFGYIKTKTRSLKRYIPFRSTILDIHKQYPQWSLREIDRALFAYHKIVGKSCSCRCRNKIKKCRGK